VTGPKPRIDHGVGAALGQIHRLHLGERSLTPVTVMTAKDGSVFGRIGEVFNRAIDGHQTQAKAKSAWGVGRGHRATQTTAQRRQGPGAQLIAPIREGAGLGQAVAGIGPDEAQAASKFAHHMGNRQMGKEIHRNDHPYGHDHIEFALALGVGTLLLEHGFDRLEGYGSFQRLDGERVTEFALGFDLASGVSHEVTPWLCSMMDAFQIMPEMSPLLLFERYWL